MYENGNQFRPPRLPRRGTLLQKAYRGQLPEWQKFCLMLLGGFIVGSILVGPAVSFGIHLGLLGVVAFQLFKR